MVADRKDHERVVILGVVRMNISPDGREIMHHDLINFLDLRVLVA